MTPYKVIQGADGKYTITPAPGQAVDGVTVFIDAARAMKAANDLNKADDTDTDIEVETTIVPDEVRKVINIITSMLSNLKM